MLFLELIKVNCLIFVLFINLLQFLAGFRNLMPILKNFFHLLALYLVFIKLTDLILKVILQFPYLCHPHINLSLI
jgi:hypothetical protein